MNSTSSTAQSVNILEFPLIPQPQNLVLKQDINKQRDPTDVVMMRSYVAYATAVFNPQPEVHDMLIIDARR
ncbi:uncharacterized protein PgNI_06814 [Pyricularia grisea]|uniref:Uncharacterized protein n=1 Tax=Pyricularia grisea TaxID=148305 RepID=A0A6P8B2C7_PYRGI|nr:uncharacterized protein PgNI_06814 [Pyricularia grisea]TLD09006.1 hypothetical protein PgNI_06814 [Pyricularia grisea]